MPTRKRYQILHDRPTQPPGFRPRGIKLAIAGTEKPNKVLSLIRGVIKEWLDASPAFKVEEWKKFLIINDSVYNDRLAVIEFKEDHLLVNLPMVDDDPYSFLSLSVRGIQDGHRIDYSDPDLHARVKRVINSAYDHRGQSGARRHKKKVSG